MTTLQTEARPSSAVDRLKSLDQGMVVGVLTIVLVAVFAASISGFATRGNAVNVLQAAAGLGILALGQAVVVIGRGLDLSVVTIYAVTAQAAVLAMTNGASEPAALLRALIVAVVLGLFNGVMIAYVELPALFVTLATGLAYLGAARFFFFDGAIAFAVPGEAKIMNAIGNDAWLGIPVSTFVWLGLAVVFWFCATRTAAGQMIYARGDNPDAAALSGMPTRPLVVLTYVVSAASAFVAGIVIVGAAGSFDSRALAAGGQLYDVLAIVVIAGVSLAGGRGSIAGVVAATCFLGVLLNAMTLMNFDTIQQALFKSLIVLAALVLDRLLHPTDEETARVGEL
ncbi:ABC transporter permease [Nocardioides campestrisoli]|uniref:ABC transporter permease n=1 Tax=Nocardioides campestrisoli TaxID=2736757 RepID=UPI00163D7140|nr:ABC transporter permease [Nocardioides campestrisoli]